VLGFGIPQAQLYPHVGESCVSAVASSSGGELCNYSSSAYASNLVFPALEQFSKARVLLDIVLSSSTKLLDVVDNSISNASKSALVQPVESLRFWGTVSGVRVKILSDSAAMHECVTPSAVKN
jgi:hypothetical protein